VSDENFDTLALQVFAYQYENNSLYRQFCDLVKKVPGNVHDCLSIPFLPISFFKTHQIITGQKQQADKIFESSGTTGSVNSRHLITDIQLYNDSLLNGFRRYFGPPEDYLFLGLLPSYLERKNASLVHMADVLMQQSHHPDNGFYLNEFDQLTEVILRNLEKGQKTMLIGVTFALLDFAEHFNGDFSGLTVIETGGMKGRRKEITRPELHETLKKAWHLDAIHSEYGMTELLSQGYSGDDGIYAPANTMRVLIRDINDPLTVTTAGTGAVNIIDLANINSCSFLATEDIGRVYENGTFEILGRLDFSALRGCSLMTV
jgi:phenylacetate-coenzyme A ligase PaaK-like adenylate-forming protein